MLSANLCLKIYKFIVSNKMVTISDICYVFNISKSICSKYIKLLKYHRFIFVTKNNDNSIFITGGF